MVRFSSIHGSEYNADWRDSLGEIKTFSAKDALAMAILVSDTYDRSNIDQVHDRAYDTAWS